MAASKILVVDDQPVNVQLLRRKLEKENLQVVTAYNGAEALKTVQEEKPDLILLDVMMPDMDGIEVCQRLQADEASRHIPVILITARTAKENKIEGLGVGAVDYLTKPIDLDETLARVRTQLRFLSINREMVDLQRRLEEVRRAATIGAITEGIAHNLNNLLGVAIGHLDLLKLQAGDPEKLRNNTQRIEGALQRIVAIVRQLTQLVIKAQPSLAQLLLPRLLADSIVRFQVEAKQAAPVAIDNPLGDLAIETNAEMIEDALAKVLMNAWEAYDLPNGSPRPIRIATRRLQHPERGDCVEIRVEDQGHGIDPEIRADMFEPFTSTKHTVGIGMGLTIARHAMTSLGGEIAVEDRTGGGSCAVLIHPIRPLAKAAAPA